MQWMPFNLIIFGLIFLPFPVSYGEPNPSTSEKTTKCYNHSPDINNGRVTTWWGFCNGENQVFLSEGGKLHQLTKEGITGQNPQINSSADIVWQGMDKSGKKVFLYKNSELKVLMFEGIKTYVAPSLNDRGEVVWQGVIEDRDEKGRPRIVNALFLFDGKKTARLDSGTNIARKPDINNNGTIVYEAWVDKADPVTKEVAKGYTGVYEIFMLDKKGGIKKLTNAQTYLDNQSPRINDKGMVVWVGLVNDKTNEIYLYDGTDIKRLTKNKYDDRAPRISQNGEVVWYGYDGRYFQIYLYDGKTVRQLTKSETDNVEPSINDNGDVVWVAKTGEYYQIQRTRLKQ